MLRRRIFFLTLIAVCLNVYWTLAVQRKRAPGEVKSPSIVIYSTDFSDGGSNWTNTDNSSSGVNWKYTTTGIARHGFYPGNDTLNSAGTTSFNGYLVFDSDSAQGVHPQEDGDITSPVIDCSGKTNVHLSFNQLLIHNQESATVSVSTDGITYAPVYEPSLSLISNQATANADYVNIDISSVADNQPVVYVRFNFSGYQDYFWMVDDITVFSSITDASISITHPNTSCSLLSDTEHADITIYNSGDETITNFPISLNADNGAFTTDTIFASILPGEFYTHTFSSAIDLTLPGLHHLGAAIQLPNDNNSLNDTIDYRLFNGPFPIGPSSYFNGFESVEELLGTRSEDANNDGNGWGGALPSNTGTLAGGLSGEADDWFFTPCIHLENNTFYNFSYAYANLAAGSTVELGVYYGPDQNSVTISNPIRNLSPVTNTTYLKDSVFFSVSQTGDYYFGFHALSQDLNSQLVIDDILISFIAVSSLAKLDETSYRIYPNPGSGKFKIETNGNTVEDKFVMIRNSLGEKIYKSSLNESMNSNIDLTNHAAGIYLLEITDHKNQTQFQSKFIIQ